ncbi:MAG: metallopeptidase TldD-related protein [Pseudomonadota bacterium]
MGGDGLAKSTDFSVDYRMQKQENITHSENYSLGLRVIIDKKSVVSSTCVFSEESLTNFVDQCVEMARESEADQFIDYPTNLTNITQESIDKLDLYDDYKPSVEKLQEMALKTEDAALAVKGITNSEGSCASYENDQYIFCNSLGFYQDYQVTNNSISVAVLAQNNDNMETDYDYSSKIFFSDLKNPEDVGQKAAEKVLKKLDSRKVKTGVFPVVFCNELSGSLVGNLAAAINGSAICNGNSFLINDLNKRIFPEYINIIDDPLIKRGLGSSPFDAETVIGQSRNIVENGVLKTWLLDMRSANKLGLKTTGHASRSISSQPYPSSTNLYMENGNISLKDLIKDIKQGLFVTNSFGMGINIITGDYSQGANGFWIENGEITYPVSEITIASNFYDMFANITPANDLEFRGSVNAPSLRIAKMTVAGQ